MINRGLRWLFFAIIVRPLIWIILGLHVRHYERLPLQGPAIIVANHNSHLDTLVLMSLFPLNDLPQVRPVAAADYFLRNRWIAWFALEIIGIIPIMRKKAEGTDPFSETYQSLAEGNIVILFPEGTRGEPEQMSQFKSGIAYLVKNCPEIPVIPIFLHGLGKALPRGEMIFIPFFCDVFIGEPLPWQEDKQRYMKSLDSAMHTLASEGQFSSWD